MIFLAFQPLAGVTFWEVQNKKNRTCLADTKGMARGVRYSFIADCKQIDAWDGKG